MADRDPWSAGTRLLWGDRERPPRGPKPSLTVQGIVAEAIRLADAEGIEMLSMQRLAAELGVGTMSLYRYVPSKDDLITLMLDAAIGSPPEIEHRDWRSALEMWARACAEIFDDHPWALSVVTRPRTMGPNEVAYVEAALHVLSGTGLSHTEMINTVILLNGFVCGIAPMLARARANERGLIDIELIAETGQAGTYPTVAAVMRSPHVRKQRGMKDSFESGLQCLLDGVAARISARC